MPGAWTPSPPPAGKAQPTSRRSRPRNPLRAGTRTTANKAEHTGAGTTPPHVRTFTSAARADVSRVRPMPCPDGPDRSPSGGSDGLPSGGYLLGARSRASRRTRPRGRQCGNHSIREAGARRPARGATPGADRATRRRHAGTRPPKSWLLSPVGTLPRTVIHRRVGDRGCSSTVSDRFLPRVSCVGSDGCPHPSRAVHNLSTPHCG